MRECLGLEEDDYAVYLRPDEEPMRVRAEQISSFDASVLGRISLQNVDVADFAESPLLPGKIANQPLSRFALWGVGGGSS